MSGRATSIQYGNTCITYQVCRRKTRKTLEISVDRIGRVAVTAPLGITNDRIESSVRSRAPWIMAQWRRQARLMPQHSRRQFVSGEAVLYLGRTYQLRVVRVDARHASMTVQAGTIAFRVSKHLSAIERRTACQRLLVQWLRERAEYHGTRVCERVCNRIGLDAAEVVVRELGRRWGSCTPGGRILLNWRSVLAPMRLFEYICAHEVCHLVHPDHSAAFRRTLDRVLPCWRELSSQLETSGYRYEV